MASPRILINGAKGRMGQALLAAAREFNLPVGAAIDLGDDLAAAVGQSDVIVDFSSPAGTRAVIDQALAQKKALVIGTTGHAAAVKAELIALAARVPCVWSGNYSVGVNVLFALTRQAASLLDSNYDAEVIEMHHRFKKDAPSGTAARLAEIILEERKLAPDALRYGREGITGERTSTEVGMHSLRGGDVIGDHTVVFAALGERVELTHKASDRAILARGALRAAQWIAGRPAGLYDMQDVLGLR
ncbi:4-hydroxy-tetrahydrodipicolinate reductase [Opitutus terrae]|uniref:4-hydroxy-tetrahydrodipicolinate reductase n=1 Tax=Opitutus terrae (strain DSM 11246 / JCM 15787 / PB90-1) TaxID=452637 RepID=B1ZN18_OPITP|nr:4-hydroxy-tetrahydrodipicolinate reductase [Opitutus terrae]ACB76470.1 Dihydrodipicolinate reductase [Opitutus terrae PB90-1]